MRGIEYISQYSQSNIALSNLTPFVSHLSISIMMPEFV